jgi:hypothetical protein
MRYRNTRTGADTDTFSESTWKSGQPQRAGWVDTEDRPVKILPKDVVDFVFKKKVVEDVKPAKPKELIDFEVKPKAPPVKEVIDTNPVKDVATEKAVTSAGGTKVTKPIKPKRNDNPKQKRPAAKRHT